MIIQKCFDVKVLNSVKKKKNYCQAKRKQSLDLYKNKKNGY